MWSMVNIWPLYFTVLFFTSHYCSILYCTDLYCTVLYCTVLYSTVLCYSLGCGLHGRTAVVCVYYIKLNKTDWWGWGSHNDVEFECKRHHFSFQAELLQRVGLLSHGWPVWFPLDPILLIAVLIAMNLQSVTFYLKILLFNDSPLCFRHFHIDHFILIYPALDYAVLIGLWSMSLWVIWPSRCCLCFLYKVK